MKGSEFMYSALDMRETPKERNERYMLERDKLRENLSIPTVDVIPAIGLLALVVSVFVYAVSVIV